MKFILLSLVLLINTVDVLDIPIKNSDVRLFVSTEKIGWLTPGSDFTEKVISYDSEHQIYKSKTYTVEIQSNTVIVSNFYDNTYCIYKIINNSLVQQSAGKIKKLD